MRACILFHWCAVAQSTPLAPGFLWAGSSAYGGASASSSSNSWAQGVAADSAGNIFLIGTFSGCTNLKLGSLVLTNNSVATVFLCKFDPLGSALWARALCTNSGFTFPYRIAGDSTDNTWVAGHFPGSTRLGTNTLVSISPSDLFLAKYDAQGNTLWVRQLGAYDASYWDDFGLAVDAAGNAVLASRYTGSAAIGNLVLTNSDGFIVKYDSSGTLLWAQPALGADAIALGTNGAVYLTGVPGRLAKYDPQGNLVWSNAFPRAKAIGVDSQENLYTTGYGTDGTYGGQTLTNVSGMPDFFVAKCDPQGQVIWLKQAGSTQQQRGTGIAVDQFANVYVTAASATAYPDPTLAFGSTLLTNVLAFVAEWDTSGNILWARAPAATNRCGLAGVTLASPGKIVVGGSFRGRVSFGTTTLIDGNSSGQGSLVVAELAGVTSPASVLQLSNVLSGAQLQIAVTGVPTLRYAVEASPNLRDWTRLATNTSPFAVSDNAPANSAQKYYRAVFVP